MDNEIRIAEVYFFVLFHHDDIKIPLALVSLYSAPDPYLLCLSMNTLCSCSYLGDGALKFINAKTIKSVVAMIPHSPSIDGQPPEDWFFLVEKPGLDVALMSGSVEDMLGEDNDATDDRDNEE